MVFLRQNTLVAFESFDIAHGLEVSLAEARVSGPKGTDAVLHDSPEVLDEALHRPGCSVAQGTDSVAFDLSGQFLEHVDFCEVCLADLHSGH